MPTCDLKDCAPVPNCSQDIIAVYNVIQHLKSPATALRFVSGLLRPGGIVAMWVPCVHDGDNIGFSPHELEALCVWAGLNPVDSFCRYSASAYNESLANSSGLLEQSQNIAATAGAVCYKPIRGERLISFYDAGEEATAEQRQFDLDYAAAGSDANQMGRGKDAQVNDTNYYTKTAVKGCAQVKATGPHYNKGEKSGPKILDPFKDRAELLRHKRHHRALFCGSGPSVNLVTEGTLAAYFNSKFDVFASNQFFVHNYLKPSFYHVELKGSSIRFWEKHFLGNTSKIAQYEGSNFIYNDDGITGMFMRKLGEVIKGNLFGYHPSSLVVKADVCGKGHGQYKSSCYPLMKSCGASTTVILDLITSMGYKHVWFLGVDLKTSSHFWNNNSAYSTDITHFQPPQARQPETKYTMKSTTKHAKTNTHPTHVRGIHVFLQSFLTFNDINALNLSPLSSSLLSIPFIEVNDLLVSREPVYWETNASVGR